MKKINILDRALTPDGKSVVLAEHDGAYSIRVDGAELMSTRQHASEEAMAGMACAHLSGVRDAKVLIGGLGFGFTLRAALAVLDPDARVVVAESLGAVIAWNRNPAYGLAGSAMSDARVSIVERDVVELLDQGPFDAIILDVDNGPAGLSLDANDRLYDPTGINRIHAALRPGGCVAIWSAAPDAPFEKRMQTAGFRVETRKARSRPNGGRRHVIFLATRCKS